MGRAKMVLALSIVAVVALTAAAADDLNLHLKGDGKVMAWGFSFEQDAKVSSETLLKGGDDVLKAIFLNAEVKGDKGKIDEVGGKFEIDKDGKITGNVKIHWLASGNPKTLTADIEGKAELADEGKKVVKLSFESKNGKVEGSWKHGSGEAMKTNGTGSFKVESQEAKSAK